MALNGRPAIRMPSGRPVFPNPLGSASTGWPVTFLAVYTLGFCQKETLR